ncbi:hypothetical protein FOA52_001074 [Chlamydomonas sp. UWO 241]|nr:hypothetical protein FOA52_001074 [Chlamydomonas sp. UWO 241]
MMISSLSVPTRAVGRPAGRLLAGWHACGRPAPLQAAHTRVQGRCVTLRAVQIAEHSLYLEEIAVTQSPKRLGALLKVLTALGGTKLMPSDRSGLHPLLIPISSDPADADAVTCLLRWPKPSTYKSAGMGLPVVSMVRGGKSVKLLARSVDEYLHRLLAEEDAAAGPGPAANAADAEGQELYTAGQVKASGLGSRMDVYLVKKAGMFPDVSEGLAKRHLAKGDVTSALVTSEWYMRNDHFPGFARPYEFASELLAGLGKRGEEARDLARVALRLPWWTLENGYAAAVATGQLEGTPAEVRYNLSDEAQARAQAKLSKGVDFKEPKTPQEVALDKAAELLDMVAAGAEPSYDAVRERLAEQYTKAGLSDVANFITCAT